MCNTRARVVCGVLQRARNHHCGRSTWAVTVEPGGGGGYTRGRGEVLAWRGTAHREGVGGGRRGVFRDGGRGDVWKGAEWTKRGGRLAANFE